MVIPSHFLWRLRKFLKKILHPNKNLTWHSLLQYHWREHPAHMKNALFFLQPWQSKSVTFLLVSKSSVSSITSGGSIELSSSSYEKKFHKFLSSEPEITWNYHWEIFASCAVVVVHANRRNCDFSVVVNFRRRLSHRWHHILFWCSMNRSFWCG